jgi:hypothetical protein
MTWTISINEQKIASSDLEMNQNYWMAFLTALSYHVNGPEKWFFRDHLR